MSVTLCGSLHCIYSSCCSVIAVAVATIVIVIVFFCVFAFVVVVVAITVIVIVIVVAVVEVSSCFVVTSKFASAAFNNRLKLFSLLHRPQ